jgi:hypothetical protein
MNIEVGNMQKEYILYVSEARVRFTKRNAYINFSWKAEGKKPVGRSRCSWEDGIRMDLTEIRWEGVDWIYLDQGRDH